MKKSWSREAQCGDSSVGLRGPLRHQLSEGAGKKKKKPLSSSAALLDIVADVIFKNNNKVTEQNKNKKSPDSAEARCANGVFSALVRADGTGAWGQRSPLGSLKRQRCGYGGASDGESEFNPVSAVTVHR